jgi:uncharacterized LabA/DUF88 family protein
MPISRVGVYVDYENVRLNGGNKMRFIALREFACRDGAEAMRLNAYIAYDDRVASKDPTYESNNNKFFNALRDYGYKVILKTVKWYTDDSGEQYRKANADLDMAVDLLLQSGDLDRVVLVTGDGDFVKVVRALQNKGCRVEIVAFENVSKELRHEADMFMPGFLIPNLIPLEQPRGVLWGDKRSKVIGRCHHYDMYRKCGFIRFINEIKGGMWIKDARKEDSPYESAYFELSDLTDASIGGKLPNREMFFQFELQINKDKKEFRAKNIELIAQL